MMESGGEGGKETVMNRLSDYEADDAISEAGRSTCSSSQPFSPNPSETDDIGDCPDGKRSGGKGRRKTGEGGGRLPAYPMSERQQLALLKQITAPESFTESPKSPVSTPGSAGRPRGKGVAKVHRRNERGETPLHICARKGEYQQCRRLLQDGADVNCVDYAGWTSLHEAANHGWYKAARVLIKHGADLNACASTSGDTPLHDAVSSGRKKLVMLFLRHGADREIRNKEGKRPIDYAEDEELRRIVRGEGGEGRWGKDSSSEEEWTDGDDALSTSTITTPTSRPSPLHYQPHPHPTPSADAILKRAEERERERERERIKLLEERMAAAELVTTSMPTVISKSSGLLVPTHGIGIPSEGPGLNKKGAEGVGQLTVLVSGCQIEKEASKMQITPTPSTLAFMDSVSTTGGVPFTSVSASPLHSLPSPLPTTPFASTPLDGPPNHHMTTPGDQLTSKGEGGGSLSGSCSTTPKIKRRASAGVRAAYSPQAAAVRSLRRRDKIMKRHHTFQSQQAKKRRMESRGSNRSSPARAKGESGPGDVYEFHSSESEEETSPSGTPGLKKSLFASKTVATTLPPLASSKDSSTAPDSICTVVSPNDVQDSTATSPQKDPTDELMEIKMEVEEDESAAPKPSVVLDVATKTEETVKIELKPPMDFSATFPPTSVLEAPAKVETRFVASSAVSTIDLEETTRDSTVQETSKEVEEEPQEGHAPSASGTEAPGPGPKVPPLRIIISRSGSDEEASEASTGASRPSQSHPYVLRHGGEETASDSGSGPKETGGPVGVGRGRPGDKETTGRMTRSKVKQGGIQLEPGVAYVNTRTGNGNGNGAEEIQENTGSGSGLLTLLPHKRKTLKKTIEPVTTTSAPVFRSHWSQSATVNQTASILSKNSYDAHKGLRRIVESKWNFGESYGTYKPPENYAKFMMSKKDYLLQRNLPSETSKINVPKNLELCMVEMYKKQEEAREKCRQQHRLDRERLILVCEKEVLRVYARNANARNPPSLSAVRVYRDAELCNPLELDRPSLMSPTRASTSDEPIEHAVETVVDKFQKRKTQLIGRQKMEAQSLQAEQHMSWESMMRKCKLLDYHHTWKPNPAFIPGVQVVEDLDILPPPS